MKKTPVNKLKYSEAVAELNNILEAMKNKNCDIDELTTMTRRASELIAECRSRLTNVSAELEETLKQINPYQNRK